MMADVITAIYENGLLRPLIPLPLKEQQIVRLQVLPDLPVDEETNQIMQALVDEGVLALPPGSSETSSLSDQERQELADQLGAASPKLLSDIIIEERGEW
jgi:predicted DNA-binding antitoxin AbrB/MazE fold protein